MAKFDTFERQLTLATAGLEPDAVNAALAAFAKQELRRLIASGQASTTYERYVNNVPGLPEEAVRVPGAILYEFVNWSVLVREALDELRKRSPVKSGRFASSFVVFADQALVTDYSTIRGGAEVIITNSQPYIRKVEGGGFLNVKGSILFESVKNVLSRRYKGAFALEMRYLNIAAGLHSSMPYILKRSAGRRKDRQAGMPISYPSIIINAV